MRRRAPAARRWLLLDFDPVRESGTSATEDELRAAIVRARGVAEALSHLVGRPLVVGDQPEGAGGQVLLPEEVAGPLGEGAGLGDYFVRVQVCVPDQIGSERCKQYDTAEAGNLKPIGLLQVYGDSDAIRFGLMTGSYGKNISGGGGARRAVGGSLAHGEKPRPPHQRHGSTRAIANPWQARSRAG